MDVALTVSAFCDSETVADLTGIRPQMPYRKHCLEGLPPMRGLVALEQKCYMASLLERMDKMSMAAGLEGRVPYLDRELVEYVNAAPADMKLHNRIPKYALRKYAASYLPDNIIERPKIGFAVPVDDWFRGEGKARELLDTITDSNSFVGDVCDMDVVRRLLKEHLQKRCDWGERVLWALCALEVWARQERAA